MTIVVTRGKESGTAYQLVLEEMLLLRQHTRLPSPTPSFWRLITNTRVERNGVPFGLRIAHAFDINGHDSLLYQCLELEKGPRMIRCCCVDPGKDVYLDRFGIILIALIGNDSNRNLRQCNGWQTLGHKSVLSFESSRIP